MIVDTLDRALGYISGPTWEAAIAYARQAAVDLPDGEHPIDDVRLYARVLSFMSGGPEAAVLESHRVYADVHVVLAGCETIRVWRAETLDVRDPYDASRDVMFYHPPVDVPVTLTLRPGDFALLLPQDAHMPTLSCGGPAPVKKLVLKIDVTSLRGLAE